MDAVITYEVLFPTILMAVLGWVVPQQLAKVMPEGVKPLLLLAALSFLILFALATLLFFGLYFLRGDSLRGVSFFAIAFVFGGAALRSTLIWLPIMIVSVANLPRRWVKETW